MKALDLANKRYSTKKYDSAKKIPQDKIDALKDILRLTPSSINIQPWKFTFVQHTEVKSKLAAASLHNEEKVNQADLVVVFSVVDDLEFFQTVVESGVLSDRHRDWYNAMRKTMPEADLKIWMAKQVYIALGVGLYASISLGLDSTPMEGIEAEKYSAILEMKEYKPILAMAVGYAAEDDFNRIEATPKLRRPLDDVIEII